MNKEILQKVNSPQDLKALSKNELCLYAEEIREYIIQTVERQGGHLSSNLGSVELSIALHYVFSTPADKILWDVGHQAYTHKIITGRRDGFACLRENGGICGFPSIKESEHDGFTMGHSSTSLSVGLGFARAREINNENFNVVSVIGDGAFSGGMAFEALNDIGDSNARMIIVLNDNEMSISKNVGALSKYFAKLRISKSYSKFKLTIKKGINAMPFFADKIIKGLDKVKNVLKTATQINKMFEQMGIKYYGPFDGHNITDLVEVFKSVEKETSPVLIHVITNKGNGYFAAEENPSKFHGVSKKEKDTQLSFSKIMGDKLSLLADNNKKIVAITAAMCDGTGLDLFAKKHSDRYFDVGIAEQHAVTMAAGLAKQGLKPYFAVYSSFLQRGFDQLIHDVCINNLPVTLLIDRAGVIGSDGVTHQGVFDVSYLKMMPNMTVFCPKDGIELENALIWSQEFNAPLAIRYPKSFEKNYGTHADIKLGKWETIKDEKNKVYILCAGNRMLDIANKTQGANIISARFIKPLDTEFLDSINKNGNLIITMEDNILSGGFYESIISYLNSKKINCNIVPLGLKDSFIDNLDIAQVFTENGICVKNINNLIKNSI